MLSNIFEEYIKVNKEYVDFVNELVNKDFANFTEDKIVDKLLDGKTKFEKLMNDTDNCEEEEEGLFLKDVKYSIVDGLFLSIDLLNFYNSKELERFKMRAVNYIRKGRVTSFF
ncbi:hypothetical protein [Clostridium butyricum]|uniref:hypothetical protein n=1 Tax=Clostridium butyricum TaxID=1492 RepID=UPI00090420B6|nr:hypothetical protein [Clostridium butyricum]APF22709.1 hypothetical protein NPD4_449 [Clostridium butyricum]